MEQKELKEILDKIHDIEIAVYGDFCLDAYWILDPNGSEVSAETGLQGQAVAEHYYTLGGASNIVANVAALEPASIEVIGVIGDDIFGRELTHQLRHLHANTDGLVTQQKNYDTVVFGKRYLEGNEQPRIDFGFLNKRSAETDEALLANLECSLKCVDAVIFNQQVPGVFSQPFIDQVHQLFEQYRDNIIILDTRHYGSSFHNVIRKTNDVEAARLNGDTALADAIIAAEDVQRYALGLHRTSQRPVFISRGPRGIITADHNEIIDIPGIQILKKTDPVGAGDTATSAIACCLACGCTPAQAAEFANLAAAVTVQKLYRTGVAHAEEILEIADATEYIYHPELADDIRQALYLNETEIEFCMPPDEIQFGRIQHAVFDHDGTISTLRQGWEEVMEPMMIKAILGNQYDTADETLYHRVRSRVRDYIDQSTGIQTIQQMQALVEMVHEFGIVPETEILADVGYKRIYNEALMQRVQKRIDKFKDHLLDISDFTIKGAVAFLHALRDKSVTLYLASGTDREDVIHEAEVLGYADLFENRIYGPVGDVTKYSKKMVIEQIMSENNLEGPQLVVFGDGPVELRECRRRGGIAIGVASDERQRHGLNLEKRSRLVRAGAHLLVPDFTQQDTLLKLLFTEL